MLEQSTLFSLCGCSSKSPPPQCPDAKKAGKIGIYTALSMTGIQPGSSFLRFAPQGFQPLGSAAAVLVIFISEWVLLVVILVIVFRLVEG